MSEASRVLCQFSNEVVTDSVFTRLNRTLWHYAPPTADAHPRFRQAMNDTLSRPGHLVRAALVLRTGQESGLSEAASEQLACALEYWHIASLLLDDLPSMDDAEQRRGHPCLHRIYGEANAILVALALINRGYALIGEAFLEQPAAIQREALAIVETAVGPSGLIGGQSRDLNYTQKSGIREIGRIAWQKTGMLFWLALALPSLADSPSQTVKYDLRALGIYWGLIYQALDDLVDFHEGDRDAQLNRPNLVRALGIVPVKFRITRLLSCARARLLRMKAVNDCWTYLDASHQEPLESRAFEVLAR